MALQIKDFSSIQSPEDWQSFFITELKLSKEDAQQYAEEFYAQKLTGANIHIGLAEANFLDHVNIPFGHVLDLKSRFAKPIIKVENPHVGSSQHVKSTHVKVP